MWFVAALLAAAVGICAQTASREWEKAAGGKIAFEVASIKQNMAEPTEANWHSNVPLNSSEAFSPTGGLFSASNQWFLQDMVFAYKLTQTQYRTLLSQAPKWAIDNRYDIEARANGNPTKDQYRLMMQALLAERFKVAYHYESKQMPVLALVLDKPGKLGPQLRQDQDGKSCQAASASANAVASKADEFPPQCTVVVPMKASAPGRVRFGARNANMALVADWLGMLTGVGIDKPIVDKTGLGKIDFFVEYSPDVPARAGFTPDRDGPAFIEALHDQLGLKLEQQTGSVEVFVLDHIEEPSLN